MIWDIHRPCITWLNSLNSSGVDCMEVVCSLSAGKAGVAINARQKKHANQDFIMELSLMGKV
jgi:hypothetical protein